MSPTEELDRESYSRWQAIEAVMTPMDRVSDYSKYVIQSYLYTRSRLFVPGRNYEDNDHGPLAAGGNAHADIMDLDRWLEKQNGEDRQTILDWMRDASLDSVAYWRGLRHRSSIKRRRDKIAENHASTQQTTPPVPRA
jgi:hypothetical protein